MPQRRPAATAWLFTRRKSVKKLSRVCRHDKLADIKVPGLIQATLAEIVGTTRSRINFFMTKFRKLGLIQYHKGNSEVTIMAEALTNSILRD